MSFRSLVRPLSFTMLAIVLLVPLGCSSEEDTPTAPGIVGQDGLDAPTDLAATANGTDAVDLAWTDANDDETGFRVQRSTTSADTGFVSIAQVDADVEAHTDDDPTLNEGTTYWYRVQALGEDGNSDFSNVAEVTLAEEVVVPAPTDFEVVAVSAFEIEIAWTAPGDPAEGVIVERSATSGSEGFEEVARAPVAVTEITDTGLTPETTYWYRARARAGEELSEFTAVLEATTDADVDRLGPPKDFAAVAIGTAAVELTWTDTADDETGYEVQRSSTSEIEGFVTAKVLPADSNAYVDDDDSVLRPGTTYWYRMRTQRNRELSDFTTVIKVVTQEDRTSTPPTNLTAAKLTSTSFEVIWTDESDDESGFDVQIRTLGTRTFSDAGSVDANVTRFVVTRLTPGTDYEVRVGARNEAGVSFSDILDVSTLPGGSPPDAPAGLTADAIAPDSVLLQWTDEADDETAYVVQGRATGRSRIFETIVDDLDPGTAKHTVTRLTADTEYEFRVGARNPFGTTFSEIVSVMTPPDRITAPSAPTNLSSRVFDSTTVTLSWTDTATNETAYVVEGRIDGTRNFTVITDSLPANTKTFTVEGLAPATTYDVRVGARNSAGTAYSDVISFTTPLR